MIKTEKLIYGALNSDQKFEGSISYDDSISTLRPGILVCHAYGGHSPFDISKAEKLAFEKISKKLLSPSDLNQIIKLNDINYEYLVESIEFVDEKISPQTYSGSFNVYFSPFKVREFYESRSLTYSELSSANSSEVPE